MSKTFDIQNLPADFVSELALKRLEVFKRYRHVVCVDTHGQYPRYRIPWEQLQEHVAHYKSKVVARLRSTAAGNEKADRFEQLPTICPVDEFCTGMKQLLEQVAQEYSPAHGFDLDLYFLLADVEGSATWSVWFEVFPRFEAGKIVRTDASPVRGHVPFMIFQTIREEDEENILGMLLWGEKIFQGKEMSLVAEEFMAHQGIWAISHPDLVHLFLNRMCGSITGFGSGEERAIVVPQTSHDFSGAALEARLRFV